MGKKLIIKGADFSDSSVDVPFKNLTLLSSDITLGTVSGGGTYEVGTTVQITATTIGTAFFVKWSDEDTNAVRNITITDNLTLTAIFSAEPPATYVYFDGSHYLNTNFIPTYDMDFTMEIYTKDIVKHTGWLSGCIGTNNVDNWGTICLKNNNTLIGFFAAAANWTQKFKAMSPLIWNAGEVVFKLTADSLKINNTEYIWSDIVPLGSARPANKILIGSCDRGGTIQTDKFNGYIKEVIIKNGDTVLLDLIGTPQNNFYDTIGGQTYNLLS